MVQKTFELAQIETRINDLYSWLDERELRLKGDQQSLDDLLHLYDQVEDLEHKLGRMRNLFKHAVEHVVDNKQNALLAQAMVTLSPDELLKLQRELLKRNQRLHATVSEDHVENDQQSQDDNLSFGDNPTK